MYQKPEVRLVEPQQVETNSTEVTSSEAAALLAKYGYKQPEFSPQPQVNNPYQNMTADQMYAQYEREIAERKQKEYQQRYGPKAVTFDNRNIHYSNSEYRDMDIDGQNIGIQVQVVSDMPIYRR